MKNIRKKLIMFVTCIIWILSIHMTAYASDGDQNAIWFMDEVYITQIPGGDYSHAGTQNFDVVGANGNRNIFAPFDCVIKKIYSGTTYGNTVIIESLDKVKYADGTLDFMSMAFAHDNDISDLYEGRVVRQGEIFYQTGNYGNATGVHSHVTCIRGKYQNDFWTKTSYGTYSSPNGIAPTSALFVSKNTKIVQTMGLNFIIVNNKYNVVYDANGGSGTMIDSNSHEIGSDYQIMKNTFKRTGYIFEGWKDDVGNTYTDSQIVLGGFLGDVTLHAQWKGISYTIKYDTQGGSSIKDQPMIYGSTAKLKSTKKTGYYVSGWTGSDGKTYSDGQTVNNLVSKNGGVIILKANWKRAKYTISFDGNGATGGYTVAMALNYNETGSLTKNGFKKTGYTFKGWKDSKNGKTYKDGQRVKNLSLIHKENIVLKAQWIANKYTISFNGNGSTNGIMSTLANCKYGTEYVLPSIVYKKKGYVFDEWNTKADGSGKRYVNKASVKNLISTNGKTVTFYAQWKKKTYSITYKLNGGTNSSNPSTYTVTSAITLKKPTKKGYKFEGWYSDSSYKNRVTRIVKGATGNKTLYAKWVANKYSIIYNLNGGKNDGSNPSSYKVTTATITLKNPKRKNYKFEGWYSDSSYKNKVTRIAKGSTGNKTLYAKWSANIYSITYNLNGGKNNSSNPSTYKITTSTITLASPRKTGYTFAGWYGDSSYKNKVTHIAKGSAGNKTLYAKWKVNKYTIKFDGNGATSGSMSKMTNCKYDTSYTLRANTFKKKNMIFLEWNTKADGSGKSYADKDFVKNLSSKTNETVTLYAQWTKNVKTYSIKFNGNGATYGSMVGITNCKFGEYYTLSWNVFERTGYVFEGWNTKADGSGKSYVDGAKVKNLTSKNGKTVILYAQWVKDGYDEKDEEDDDNSRKIIKTLLPGNYHIVSSEDGCPYRIISTNGCVASYIAYNYENKIRQIVYKENIGNEFVESFGTSGIDITIEEGQMEIVSLWNETEEEKSELFVSDLGHPVVFGKILNKGDSLTIENEYFNGHIGSNSVMVYGEAVTEDNIVRTTRTDYWWNRYMGWEIEETSSEDSFTSFYTYCESCNIIEYTVLEGKVKVFIKYEDKDKLIFK